MNKIILTSGDKIFYFDKKILSSISNFVKSFEEVENEITTIPIKDILFNKTQSLFPLEDPSVILANTLTIYIFYSTYFSGHIKSERRIKNKNFIKFFIF